MMVIPSLVNAVSRVTSVIVNLIVFSIALRYLGEELFGVWTVIVSMVLMLAAFGDGGIGQGLISSVSKFRVRQGDAGVSSAASAAFTIVIVLCLVLLLVGLFVLQYINWEFFLGISRDDLITSAAQTALTVFFGMIVSIIANVFMNIRHGLEQIIQISIWNIVGSLLVIPSIIIVTQMQLSVSWVAAAVLYPPILVRFIVHGGYIMFHHNYRPRPSAVNKVAMSQVAKSGGAFFIIAISQAIAIHSDQLIISSFHGPAEVTPYALMYRLFVLPIFLATSILNVLWPRLSRFYAGGDIQGLRNNFVKTAGAVTVGGGVVTLSLYALTDVVFQLWLGEIPKYNDLLLLGMVLYSLLVIPVSCLTLLVINMESHRLQLICSLLMTVSNLSLTLILVPTYGSGGAILATAIAYFVFLLVPYSIFGLRRLKR